MSDAAAPKSLEDIRAWFAGRRAEYGAPLCAFLQSDEVRELAAGDDPLAREDELRFVEAVVQATGLGMPGAVFICRHEEAGWVMAAAMPDGFSFHRLPEDASRIEPMARPDFWAAEVNTRPGTDGLYWT